MLLLVNLMSAFVLVRKQSCHHSVWVMHHMQLSMFQFSSYVFYAILYSFA